MDSIFICIFLSLPYFFLIFFVFFISIGLVCCNCYPISIRDGWQCSATLSTQKKYRVLQEDDVVSGIRSFLVHWVACGKDFGGFEYPKIDSFTQITACSQESTWRNLKIDPSYSDRGTSSFNLSYQIPKRTPFWTGPCNRISICGSRTFRIWHRRREEF